MSDFQASPELLTIYLEDARSHLEALDHCLLALEREGLDPAVVAAVQGPLHTLKGNSGMMGFAAIKEYVHRLEDVFARITDGGMRLTPACFDQLFHGASALRDAVERACVRQGEARDLGPEKAVLENLLREGDPVPTPARAAPAAALTPAAPAAAAAALPVPAARAAPAAPRTVDAHYVATRSSTVRVDFSQLDHLLNLVGELIVYRTKLLQIGKDLAETVAGRAAGRELMAAVHHVGGVSALLQETVMDIRMLPVRHVFERFPRLVRDLAHEQGKEIELILEGETTRVDKAIIDEIGEPLVHLIRNSVDHGIEDPETRVARGKTRTGTVLLSAAQESNQVVITIMDDGAGIDAARVYRKAVERGILKGDEALSEREAVQLVFAQGFSTREAVTDLSGRGVGLDVVLKSIERLNGLIEVETVPGVGTKFIIQLPLTLAIISVLIVEVAGRTYAVPLSSVVETVRLEAGELHRINNRETLRIRERIIPVLRLAGLFGLEAGQDDARRYAVIIGRGDKRVGIVVDGLKGQQEVVIKALDPAVTGDPPVVAGATIMGDGRVVLILDVAALFEGKRQALLRGRSEPGPAALAEGQPR
jgi:two-component system, chemotaxis family, sensor kinase CheA